MNIAWESFTPASSLAGGVLIGIAAALLLLFNGRIAGISGILAGILRGERREAPWRVMFILGMFAAPSLYGLLFTLPKIDIAASVPELIVAGLLVGLGTRYGSGCTSGHGVCGLSRLSLRSLAATLTFIFTGAMTVFVLNPLSGG